MDNALLLTEINCERVEYGKNGWIIFQLQKYPHIFVLMDDDLVAGIKNHANVTFHSQSINKCREILERAVNDNAYILVKTYLLSGNKIYEIKYSPSFHLMLH